ncbi:Uncharacterised protein [[Clostridium] sordellii]|uniref:hypothetical protein n=1 Tax=Paraclostridium sordellii TaxID=1505 RepID=UPI0005E36B3A|nr:hypothetical protein [Paeniclostridium sordellii]CEP50285.1 Uncharacterised protein [[Clostridium] sordellii] [Paeniclostridium sordellii]
MTQYRKKSEIVEAIKWTGDIESIETIDWVKEEIKKENILFAVDGEKDKDAVCLVDIGDEILKVKKMDYIVKNKLGVAPMNEEDFNKMYEPVNKCVIEAKIDTSAIAERVNETIQKFKDDLRKKGINV